MKRTACLATIPERAQSLARTLKSLHRQVDQIFVYLNGYKSVPGIIKQLGCGYAMSSDHGDLGDAGKFFWADKITEGWCFTCDDDFLYKPRYIKVLVKAAERLGRQCPVSLHGVILNEPLRLGNDVDWLKDGRKRWLRAVHAVHEDTKVHLVGTGVLCYPAGLLDLSIDDFPVPNTADIWFSHACKRQGIERYVAAHPPLMAEAIAPPVPTGPQVKRRGGEYSKLIASCAPWEEI